MSAYVTFYVKNKDDLVELMSYSRNNPIAKALMDIVPYGKVVLFDEEIQKKALFLIKRDIKNYKRELKQNKFLMKSPNPEIDPIGLMEENKEIELDLEFAKKQKNDLKLFVKIQNDAQFTEKNDKNFVWVGYENPYAHFEDGNIVYDSGEF